MVTNTKDSCLEKGIPPARAPTFLNRLPWTITIVFIVGLLVAMMMIFIWLSPPTNFAQDSILARRWGGFLQRPLDNKCYRQQGTATLLALFLGPLAVDQWYTHHWGLAVAKMSWFLVSSLFISAKRPRFASACGSVSGIWSTVDVVLWIVGGVYSTPGCRGGY